jgi:2-polyprenyl-3-methyl-5-hydroxy-6-metoxy-1,4-benzoquinol methylase
MIDRTSQMERLLGHFTGYFATYLILTGVDSGIFEALVSHSDGADAGELAHDLHLAPRYVDHFLRAGLAVQLLDVDPASGHYSLAPHMDVLLAQPDDYRYMGALARLYVESARIFDDVPGMLRSGDTRTYQEQREALIEAAAAATEGLAEFVARAIVRRLPNLRGNPDLAILDLGCGTGALLVALAKALPDSRIVGLDVEARSVQKAKARIRAAGFEDRVEAQLAAAEDLGQAGVFDLITMVQVLHETRENTRATILARAYTALRPGGSLVMIDEPYPAGPEQLRERPVAALAQFVEIFLGNVMLSPEHQQRLLQDAGFEVLSQMIPPPGMICVTIARKNP